jgi:hypothetical protein
MTRGIIRQTRLYGKGGMLGVGKSKYFDDIVFHDESDPYIPGTNIPRLRLASLGKLTKVAFEDEVFALIEALRAERDAKLTETVNKALREGAA